ncbi:MAG: TIGR03016 family PEP-CTERM system-associated outer membrane protein [Thiohalorhabdus sp.]|uniref:TIGR03016 family PEP-CTERM system-associated outer membrane protein n=1 Tax=Thiohalorhabdus sp. TaxID=3094134 RepID=UPI00397F7B91
MVATALAAPAPVLGQGVSAQGTGALFGATPFGEGTDEGTESGDRAGEWVLAPRLTLGETISDNFALAPPGEEEWDLISQITPGIRVERDGTRTQAYLDYQAQSLFYVRNPESDGVFHQLEANGTGELWRNHLFLDGAASYTQQLISPLGAVPESNLVPTANRTDVATYELSPYYVQRLGSFADARARYTYNRVDYETQSLSDTESNGVSASLDSGERYDDLGWRASYSREEERLEDWPDRTFERASGELSHRLGSKTEVFGMYGYEDNDYETDPTGDATGGDLSSDFWEAGMRYSPTPRTFLEGAYGERYFGNTWRANLEHSTRQTNWQVGYSETIETESQLQADTLNMRLTDPSGNTITDEEGNPILLEVPFSLQVQDVFLRKRWNADVTADTGKSQFRLSGYQESRDYQRTGLEEEGYGAGTGWTWRIAPRTRAITRLSWDHHDLAFQGDRKDDVWRFGVRLARELRRQLTTSVDYQYLRRDSNQSSAEYRQNSVTLLLRKVF